MCKKITAILLALVLFSAVASGADRMFTLVIDAGHGGHDAGAVGAFSSEKDINLSVALAFGRYVERNCPDVKVVYTRKTDVFVPLHKRASIANKNKADVFISIHTNALPKGHIARGLETYTMGMRRSDEKLSAAKRENSVIMIEKDYKEHYEGYDPNSPESIIMFEFMHNKNMARSVELAKLVQSNVCSTAKRQNKGVKQDVFLVLRETSMPSILVELGYITNPTEASFLISENGSATMARSIYTAIANYRNQQRNVRSGGNRETTPVTNIPADETDSASREAIPEAPAVPADTRAPQANGSEVQPARHASKQEASRPVFKIQITTSSRVLPKGSRQLKGLTPVSYYKENGLVKYTYGEDTDYNRILRLKRTKVDAKFKDAFIIAFKDGQKMNINEAIREFKRNRRK